MSWEVLALTAVVGFVFRSAPYWINLRQGQLSFHPRLARFLLITSQAMLGVFVLALLLPSENYLDLSSYGDETFLIALSLGAVAFGSAYIGASGNVVFFVVTLILLGALGLGWVQ